MKIERSRKQAAQPGHIDAARLRQHIARLPDHAQRLGRDHLRQVLAIGGQQLLGQGLGGVAALLQGRGALGKGAAILRDPLTIDIPQGFVAVKAQLAGQPVHGAGRQARAGRDAAHGMQRHFLGMIDGIARGALQGGRQGLIAVFDQFVDCALVHLVLPSGGGSGVRRRRGAHAGNRRVDRLAEQIHGHVQFFAAGDVGRRQQYVVALFAIDGAAAGVA